MKILLLACLTKNKSGNSFGGAEKSIINLANWLARNEYSVTLASVEGKEQAFFVEKNVDFKAYELKKKSKLSTHFQIFLNTQRAVFETKPDIIIGFWIHPMFYFCLNPIFRKIKMIYSERNDPNLEYGKIAKFMRKIVLQHASGIVFQTLDAKRYFSDSIKKKSIVIHNPVYLETHQYPIVEERDNRIVSVGRLNSQKNFSLLIDSFSTIEKEFPNLVLEIYGEGPLRDELENKITMLNLSGKVKLMGAHKNVLDRIYGARLFVLPSNYEGMPNALMEAMCLGIPVISSDCPCGGPRELIKDGVNGFLFEPQNRNHLIQKMKYVLTMDDKDIKPILNEEKKICITHSQDFIFGQWVNYISHVKEYKE